MSVASDAGVARSPVGGGRGAGDGGIADGERASAELEPPTRPVVPAEAPGAVAGGGTAAVAGGAAALGRAEAPGRGGAVGGVAAAAVAAGAPGRGAVTGHADAGTRGAAAAPTAAPPPTAGASRAPADAGARAAAREELDANTATGHEAVTLHVARSAGGAVLRRRVSGRSSLAQVVAKLVPAQVPLPTTPDGRLAGWYRLGPASGPLPPGTRAGGVPHGGLLVLHRVENRVVALEVEVAGPSPLVLRVPVGTAVPVGALVDGLVEMLRLTGPEWALVVGGEALGPEAILADLPNPDELRLVLTRGEGGSP